MKKPSSKITTTNRCKDCKYCTPSMERLTVEKEGQKPKPILGTCPYQESKFLINHYYCEKFTR